MSRLPVVLALSVLLTVTGCSNRENAQARAPRNTGTGTAHVAADGVQEMAITGTEQFRFVPSTIHAKPGQLRLLLTNSGTTPHDLQVEGQSQSTGLVGAGETARITVDLLPGRYTFICTLHTRLHMMGTIVVS